MSTSTTQSSTIPEIEIATSEDIAGAAEVYQAAAEDLSNQLRARNPWGNSEARAEDLQQAIRTLSALQVNNDRALIVARLDDQIVGMAAVQIQAPHAHIAFFFVHPTAQNQGVGRRLLEQVRKLIDESGATVTTLASSRDPRAWQRYMRFGLHPGSPQLPFRAAKPLFPEKAPTDDRYLVRTFTPADIDIIADLDLMVRGASRRARIAQWLDEGSAGSLVTSSATGKPIGYALVTIREHHGQIGPVVASSVETFPFMLEVALSKAGATHEAESRPWRADFSARNTMAIPRLLEAGFSAENIVNWFESEPVGKWDHSIFRDEDEL